MTGRVSDDHPGIVVARTGLGARRVVDRLLGEQLPRICCRRPLPGRLRIGVLSNQSLHSYVCTGGPESPATGKRYL